MQGAVVVSALMVVRARDDVFERRPCCVLNGSLQEKSGRRRWPLAKATSREKQPRDKDR